MKCYVATNQAAEAKIARAGKSLRRIGPSPGFTNLRWLKPVTPGDTVTYPLTVTGQARAGIAARSGASCSR